MNDLISRQVAVAEISKQQTYKMFEGEDTVYFDANDIMSVLADLPSAQTEIIYCKDCRWWDKEAEDSRMGYCHACKHSHYSRHWEIRIIRTYEENFFCADAEPKEEGEKNE